MNKGLISILSALVGAGTGAVAVGKTMGEKTENLQKMSDKHLALFLMMNQWVKVKQEEKNIADYLVKNGYQKIAIYGMSYAGETLVKELEGSGVAVEYAIDKKADAIYKEFNVYNPDDDLEVVDAVIVTTITFFDEVVEALSKKIDCPIISLEDILYEI